MKGRPADFPRVVKRHWKDTTAYIVSSHDPMCLQMAKDEVRWIDRRMVHVLLDALPGGPGNSWFMAIIVCPGDDLAGLARWMTTHGVGRVRFYLHTEATARQLAPIRDAGHDLRHVRPERYEAYGPMHKRLGLDLSDQIYEDWAP